MKDIVVRWIPFIAVPEYLKLYALLAANCRNQYLVWKVTYSILSVLLF